DDVVEEGAADVDQRLHPAGGHGRLVLVELGGVGGPAHPGAEPPREEHGPADGGGAHSLISHAMSARGGWRSVRRTRLGPERALIITGFSGGADRDSRARAC